jgi:hypothetical protein
MNEIDAIRRRNDARKKLKARCSPAPWYVRYLDDDYAANLVAVSTRPDTDRHERWPKFNGDEIVAATLIQTPERYVDVADELWDENAEFIAFSRNDVVEDDIDLLLQEIERLRATLEQTC